MHKDWKIGLVVGLIFVIFLTLRLATDPRLSTKARMEQAESESVTDTPTPPLITETLTSESAAEKIGPANRINEIATNNIEKTARKNNNPGTDSVKTQEGLKPETKDNSATKPFSEDKQPLIPKQTEKIKPQRFHIVTKNQTLSDIAYKYYGAASKWPKIFVANQNILSDPNKLQPGIKLIIPE